MSHTRPHKNQTYNQSTVEPFIIHTGGNCGSLNLVLETGLMRFWCPTSNSWSPIETHKWQPCLKVRLLQLTQKHKQPITVKVPRYQASSVGIYLNERFLWSQMWNPVYKLVQLKSYNWNQMTNEWQHSPELDGLVQHGGWTVAYAPQKDKEEVTCSYAWTESLNRYLIFLTDKYK